jgi:hypothetical protein
MSASLKTMKTGWFAMFAALCAAMPVAVLAQSQVVHLRCTGNNIDPFPITINFLERTSANRLGDVWPITISEGQITAAWVHTGSGNEVYVYALDRGSLLFQETTYAISAAERASLSGLVRGTPASRSAFVAAVVNLVRGRDGTRGVPASCQRIDRAI